MADLQRYKQHERIADEEKIESMGKLLPPDELDANFMFRFEGYDKGGAYFSTTYNGALYYLDFLSNVPLINVRRRGARHYWQVSSYEKAVEQMKEDYRRWQIDMTKAEQAEDADEGEHDTDDLPF